MLNLFISELSRSFYIVQGLIYHHHHTCTSALQINIYDNYIWAFLFHILNIKVSQKYSFILDIFLNAKEMSRHSVGN